MDYINYNREERDICTHLFRLLLEDQPNWRPLKEFLNKDNAENPRIFCEVAIIRDAYFIRKPEVQKFMSSMCDLIAQQNKITNYTHFENLPKDLQNSAKTHPKQIAFKLKELNKNWVKNVTFWYEKFKPKRNSQTINFCD